MWRLVRGVVALAVVAALVVAVVQLRDRGYLGAVQEGGPLEVVVGDAGVGAKLGRRVVWPGAHLAAASGGTIVIDGVDPIEPPASLRLAPIRIRGEGVAVLARGAHLSGGERVTLVVAMRATRTGRSVLPGLRVRYHRGLRRFRREVRRMLVVCAGRHRKARCN